MMLYIFSLSRFLRPDGLDHGEWTTFNDTSCGSGYITGTAIKIQSIQGGGNDRDDWGATNLTMFCGNSEELNITGEYKR